METLAQSFHFFGLYYKIKNDKVKESGRQS